MREQENNKIGKLILITSFRKKNLENIQVGNIVVILLVIFSEPGGKKETSCNLAHETGQKHLLF